MDSGGRSGDLETGLSSNAGTTRAETDTTTSMPSFAPSSSYPSVSVTSRPFHALKEECSLKGDTLSRFRDSSETAYAEFVANRHKLYVKERPKLESRFGEPVQEAVKYAGTIKDFDELVDPWTLAHHCLGPDPSHYILRAIRREEKKSKLSLR
ncbi:hypothetical protein SO802_003636 [Lithocarpus litseifolius]|uniref:Uncharacterized protein n=1 Tax=Lithocarpus litseifolius TaxID=425828 RepID=A0AAW2E0L2_9ROSI